MKTCISGRTEIMWNTHRVGVTADNIVRYKASSLTVLPHSLVTPSSLDISIYSNMIRHGGLRHVWVVHGIDLTFYEGCGYSNGLHPEGCLSFQGFFGPTFRTIDQN